MPIEDIKIVRAPRNWQPTRDQAQRVAQDQRLRRLSRDELYHALNNQPRGGTRPVTAGEQIQGHADNAMSWHPKNILEYVTNALAGALR